MIAFIRKILKDRRGNALVVACAAMPLIVGSAGLATDTIQWTLWKRQLQRAADSAAMAGVYDRESNVGATTTTSATVSHDVAINNHTWMGLASGYPIVAYPANTAVLSNQVRVTLAIQQSLPFTSMFMSTPPTIFAVSTAAAISSGTPCMLATEPSASVTGISNNGNTTVNAPTCILYSNSPSTNSASAGGSSSITAKAIAAVGGISQSNQWHVQQYIPYSPPVPDPFASVSPDPNQMNCTSATLDENTNFSTLGTTNCFSSISLNPNRTINVPNNFGPIYVNGGNVDLKGTFNCSGCTIVLTNKSTVTTPAPTIGSFTSNAQAQNNITAPTSGTYKGIAIYQDRRASGTTNKVNGGSNNVIQGAVYFPNSVLQINGTGNAVSLCAMWVGKDIALIGTSSITISSPDDAVCTGTGLPTGGVHMVRLVA